MARNIVNTRSYRRRRLATLIREIKKALRKGDCYRAEAILEDAMIGAQVDRYSVAMRQSSFRVLRNQINRCHRRGR